MTEVLRENLLTEDELIKLKLVNASPEDIRKAAAKIQEQVARESLHQTVELPPAAIKELAHPENYRQAA